MARWRPASPPICPKCWATCARRCCNRQGGASRPPVVWRSVMTTCVAVRKNGEVAIAADSLVTFGDTRLPGTYEANSKIFQVGDSWVTLAGTTAHFPVMRKVLTEMGDDCRLNSK